MTKLIGALLLTSAAFISIITLQKSSPDQLLSKINFYRQISYKNIAFAHLPKTTPTPTISPNSSTNTFTNRNGEINFSGYTWDVRSNSSVEEPGPNLFSNNPANVFVDSAGRLHLKITNRNGHWYSSEIDGLKSLGYGTYRFYIDSAVGGLDPNTVVGLFTYSDTPDFNNREIDIEFGKWGYVNGQNAEFSVQPYQIPGNSTQFNLSPNLLSSIHEFTWIPGKVSFDSQDSSSNIISSFVVAQGVPPEGDEVPVINFWLNEGKAPMNNQDAEVIISKFSFTPLN